MEQLSIITAKTDPALKADAEVVFKELGMSLDEAINLFLIQVKHHRTLPFDFEMPNEDTARALNEAENDTDMIVCENEDDMFKKLGKGIKIIH